MYTRHAILPVSRCSSEVPPLPTRSIELATKAADLTEHKQAHILSTLAAGYAETGDFKKAIEWSEKAVAIGARKPRAWVPPKVERTKIPKPKKSTVEE